MLLGMCDMELLGILKIMYEVVGGQEADRKFDCQTIQSSSTSFCKTNTDRETKSDNADVIDAYSNIPDYFRSSINKAAHKKACQVLTQ